MRDDPIVDEVRRVREENARKYDFDLRAIWLDIKAQEQQSDRTFATYPARPPVRLRDPSSVTNGPTG